MTPCVEMAEKAGTNGGRAAGMVPRSVYVNPTMGQTNALHVLFHSRVKSKDYSRGSARHVQRLSNRTLFSSKRWPHLNMKTCWSQHRQAAAKRGLRAKRFAGF